MRRSSSRALLAAGILLLGSSLEAEPARPQPVSPGSVAVSETLGTACPTFSWSGVPEATGYQLVVYRVTESGSLEAEFEVEVPGDARGWTPPASKCPTAGSRYAWAVRITEKDGFGAWSEALLFEPAQTPSASEVRRALRVLRRYTEMMRLGADEAPDADTSSARRHELARFRDERLRPGLEAIRRDLNREARATDAETGGPGSQTVTPPASFSLAIDGDFDLGGFVFKGGVPFLHDDGGAASGNTALGSNALVSATPGSPSLDDGTRNTAVGYGTLQSNTTGRHNTATGYRALYSNTQGSRNTANGDWALRSNTYGDRNTAVGYGALVSNTQGPRNTAIGFEALRDNLTASENTAVGAEALRINTGQGNTAVGHQALESNTSGYYNTAVGWLAGSNWTSGSYNIAIGYRAYGLAGESGVIRIGGSDYQTQTYIEGIRGASGSTAFDEAVCTNSSEQLGPCSASSRRFKEAVETMGDTAALVTALRPVTFRFERSGETDSSAPLQYGLIAEEVAEVLPTLVSYDEEGLPFAVRYELLTPLLLDQIQRQVTRLERQEAVVEEQRTELGRLREQVERLERWKRQVTQTRP